MDDYRCPNCGDTLESLSCLLVDHAGTLRHMANQKLCKTCKTCNLLVDALFNDDECIHCAANSLVASKPE